MYMGGTGGHFLSAFIRAASTQGQSVPNCFNLSNYGNAHRAIIDLGSAGGVSVPVDVQIATILKKPMVNPPYYPPMHLIDTDAVMQVFKRAIKITYEGFDVYEISNVYFIKWGIDEGNFKITNMDEYRAKLSSILWMTFKNHQNFRSSDDLYEGRLLTISWKEIYKADVDDLILKLSQFTNIPKQNFPKHELEEWRRRTTKGIDLVNKILNTDNIGLVNNDYPN